MFYVLQLYEGSALYTAYLQHLSASIASYQRISDDLTAKFGHGPSTIAALQGEWNMSCDSHVTLCNIFFSDLGSLESQHHWLKEIHYTILLRLGDLCKSLSL